jgi:FAD/FMN-containing dehydrogenase
MTTSLDELLEGAQLRGDDPADRFIEWLVKDVAPGRLLEELQNTARLCTYKHLEHEPGHPGDLLHGRRAAPEFEAFLAASSQAPAWLDPPRVARGTEFFRRYVAAASLALGTASLPTCYCWSREAQVLMRTQRLARDLPRRILETAQFVLDVMSPDGLRLGQPYARGVRAVQKVRLLHAVVRYILRHRRSMYAVALSQHQATGPAELMRAGQANPWLGLLLPGPPDEARTTQAQTVIAINQEELAGTLVTFSIVILQSLERVGIQMSEQEKLDYLFAWKLVGHLLGIEPQLLEYTGDMARAEQLRLGLMRRQRRQTDNARLLTSALSDYLAQDINLLFGADRWLPVQRIPKLCMRLLLEPETLAADGVRLDLIDRLLYGPFYLAMLVLGHLQNKRWVGALSKFLFGYLIRKVWGWRKVPFAPQPAEPVTQPAAPAPSSAAEPGPAARLENWSATLQTRPARVEHPSSAGAIAHILGDAQQYPSPVRVMGSYHSTTPCSSADSGTIIRVDRLARVLEIGPDFVEAEAGALYIDVAHELDRRGLEFYVNLQIGNITMGAAACSTTKDGAFPGEFAQASSYCTAMTMVTPDGKVRTISDAEPGLMQAARCSHGLLGVVCAARFRVRPIQPIAIEHRDISLEQFLQQLPALMAGDHSLEYYLYPFIDRVTLQIRSKTQAAGRVNHWVWPLRNFSVSIAVPAAARWLGSLRWPGLAQALSGAFYGFSGHALQWFCSAAKTHASEQTTQYLEPPGRYGFTFGLWSFPVARFAPILRDYVALLKAHYAQTGWRSHMPTVGYLVSCDANALLSYSMAGPVLTIDPTGFGGEGWDRFIDRYNAFCCERGGIPLLNQTPRLSREQVRRSFGERLQRFEQIRRTMDPGNRLLNPYFADLLQGEAPDLSASPVTDSAPGR